MAIVAKLCLSHWTSPRTSMLISAATFRVRSALTPLLLLLVPLQMLYRDLTVVRSGFTDPARKVRAFPSDVGRNQTVVMPFGADVHVLTRSKNLPMLNAYSQDYPGFRHQRKRTAALIDVWTQRADHIISGCDWVDYMYYWDSLMLSQFAIDTDRLKPAEKSQPLDEPSVPLRLLHAPNHRALKGTDHILRAVDELCVRHGHRAHDRGGVPNEKTSSIIQAADVVVDQLIVGWYAMFAMEVMALGKPVVCHIRPQYRDLYVGVA